MLKFQKAVPKRFQIVGGARPSMHRAVWLELHCIALYSFSTACETRINYGGGLIKCTLYHFLHA